MSALLFFLLAGAAGWWTRLSLAAACVLWTYFNMLDILSSMTKYSVIATHGLLILSFSRCGAVWSIDRWIEDRGRRRLWHGPGSLDELRVAAWPRRLLQLLVGAVYFGAAITKCRTSGYLGGDQLLYWSMKDSNFTGPVGEYLTLHPALYVIMAYVCLVWEFLFVFLVWRGTARKVMLVTGVGFHVMTAFVLGLWIFPFVALSVYLAFLEEGEAQRAIVAVRRFVRRIRIRLGALPRIERGKAQIASPISPTASAATFALLLVAVAFIGVEAEYWLDPYGERRPEGRYKLREVPYVQVQKMIHHSEPLRDSDKFFSVDIGSTLIANLLVRTRESFHQGEMLIVQCMLTVPHEDMWLEYTLNDAHGQLIDQKRTLAQRHSTRNRTQFPLSDVYEPGEYHVRVRTGGEVIMERRFTLLPRDGKPVAN
jgi:hypothetical protein